MLKFNRLFPLFLALLLPVTALAQGVIVSPQTALKTVNGTTSTIAGATITVCAANTSGLPCSPALVGATFKDAALSVPLANPFTADANGNYNFAIASGTYTVTVTASGFTGFTYQLSVTCPPAGPCSFTTVTATSLNVASLTVTGSANLPGRPLSVQTFTSSGTFTIPTGITSVRITVLAGGGAGGGSTVANSGGGGAAGGLALKWLSGLTPGNTLAVTVGLGGTANSGAAGNNGGASSVASGTQVISTITATGGGGGASSGAISTSGSTSPGTGGDVNVGSRALQGNGVLGGNGATSLLGGGGQGASGANPGESAVTWGLGGGGGGAGNGSTQSGGVGAPGIVIFEWVN